MKIRSSRGPLVLLVVIGLLLASCGDSDDGASTTTTASTQPSNGGDTTTTTAEPIEMQTVTVMMYPGQSYRLPVLVADQQGYFAARGIEIEVVEQPGNLPGIQGLEATGADLGYFSISTLAQAFQAGADSKFFCGSLPLTETSLVAAPDTDLPSTEDGASGEEVLAALSGTTISVQTPIGSGLQLFFQKALEEAGVTGVTYVNLGVQLPIILPALQNGDVDAAQMNPAALQEAMVQGEVKRLIFLADHLDAYRLYGSAMGGRLAFIEDSPELAAGYCEAIGEALDYILDPANAAEVDAMLADETGVSVEAAALIRQESFPAYSTEIPEDQMNDTLQVYTDLGVLEPEPAATFESIVLLPRP